MVALSSSNQLQSLVALDNLTHLLTERVGTKSNPSKMAIQDAQANFRMQNSEWREAMKQASTRVIARETLYTLAEIRQELHESRKNDERLVASLSMIQAMLTEINRDKIDHAHKKVQDKIPR